MFLGRHYKIVSFILVVDNILKINPSLFSQVCKKLLIENESHSTYFFNSSFFCCLAINKIASYANGKLSSEFFPLKSFQCITTAISTNNDIKFIFTDRMR